MIVFHSVEVTHTYSRFDIRKKKEYGCILSFQATLQGENLQNLQCGKISQKVRDEIEKISLPDEDPSSIDIRCTRGHSLLVQIVCPAQKPSKILSEEEALEIFQPIRDTLLNPEPYETLVEKTNAQVVLVREGYVPLLEEIQEHRERAREKATKFGEELKKYVEGKPGQRLSGVLWSFSEFLTSELTLEEWSTLEGKILSAQEHGVEASMALEREVENRTYEVLQERTHKSTAILDNAINYHQDLVKKAILRQVRSFSFWRER